MIKIYDNFLDREELLAVSNALMKRSWWFIDDYIENEQDFHNNRTLGATKNNLNDFDSCDYFFINKLNSKLNIKLDLRYIRILMNCFKYGDTPTPHTDNLVGGPTFLFFTNPTWKWWWSSGIKIENKFVRAKPGRLVIFNGSKVHNAKPPNFLYKGPGRFSYAIQYQTVLLINQ